MSIVGFLRFLKETLLEDDDEENAYGNGRIGDVENGAEEEKGFTTPDGKPLGEGAFKHGEVQHIDHFTLKPVAIGAAALGKFRAGDEYGFLVAQAFSKDHTVENAVDNIAQGAGQYQ